MSEYSHIFVGNIPVMAAEKLYRMGVRDSGPGEGIEDCHRGLTYEYSYTGRREGQDQIELHVTTIVTDWREQVFIRKAWYLGKKGLWKECIRGQLQTHLRDLGVDNLMLKRMLRDFEVSRDRFVDWERYDPVTYGMFGC